MLWQSYGGRYEAFRKYEFDGGCDFDFVDHKTNKSFTVTVILNETGEVEKVESYSRTFYPAFINDIVADMAIHH